MPATVGGSNLLASLLSLEISVSNLRTSVQRLVDTGATGPFVEQQKEIYKLSRDSLYAQEKIVYDMIVNQMRATYADPATFAALPDVIRKPLSEMQADIAVSLIPVPQKMPDIGAYGSRGLGEPISVTAGVIIVFVVAIIAVAIVAAIAYKLQADAQTEQTLHAQDTQIREQQATVDKYYACLQSGKSAEACSIPLSTIPNLPEGRKQSEGLPWWVWGIGIGAVATVGVAGYLYYKQGSTVAKWALPKGTSGYNLEV